MGKVTIIQEFCPDEEAYELRMCIKARDYHGVLWDVDQKIRSKLKYGEDEWLRIEGALEFLDELRSDINDSGVLSE